MKRCPAVVLLHGFTGLPEVWGQVVERLAAHTRVVRPLLGGHGGLAGEAASFEDEVDRIARLVHNEIGVGAHLAGYSLGGRLGFGLLVRHPGLFSGATLIGAHPGLEDQAQRCSRAVADARWADVLERDGLLAFLAAWQSLPLFASQQNLPEKAREQQRAWRLAHDPNGLAWSLRTLSLGCMPAWGPRLCEIHVPVRLVVGALDDKFGTLATWAASRLPQGQVRRMEKSGHNVVLEQPSALAELLRGELEA